MSDSTIVVDDGKGHVKHYEVIPDGSQRLHRINGPAIDFTNGFKAWYKHGLPHRFGGPAVTSPSLPDTWYVEGHKVDALTASKIFAAFEDPP